MLSAEYFRRRIDICLRLSTIASSKEQASRLIAMAEDYKAKADAIEALEAKSKVAPAGANHPKRLAR